MEKKAKNILGLSVTGSDNYWLGALVVAHSILKNADHQIDEILVATDQDLEFDFFSSVVKSFYQMNVRRVIPRPFYADHLPNMRGNYSTYWKFDLFNTLKNDEMLIYVDTDVVAVQSLNLNQIRYLLGESGNKFAAVPAQRPVLERWISLGLKSPYDYFNAGVLFGFYSECYSTVNLSKAFEELLSIDTLKLHWHDQDIFNYIHRSGYFKLPYVYNVHTGLLVQAFRSCSGMNDLVGADIFNSVKIYHLSGGYSFNKLFHPAKKFIRDSLLEIANLISKEPIFKLGSSDKFLHTFHSSLNASIGGLNSQSIDYLLQSLHLRKRVFSREYYPSIKKIIKKIFSY